MPLRRRIAVQKTWATTPWEWHTGHNVLVMSMVIFEASNRKVEAVRGNVELGDVVDTLSIRCRYVDGGPLSHFQT